MRHGRVLRRFSVAGIALAAGLLGCGGDESTAPAARELNSPNIPNGGVFQHTFANGGVFPYRCTIHPCMTGASVTVTGTGADSVVVNIVAGGSGCAGAYSPNAVSVKPGGYVRWVNQSVPHTVTSP